MKLRREFLQAVALFRHEWLREWRQGQWLAGSLLYLTSGIFVTQLLLRPAGPVTWLTLFWILILFTVVYVLSRSFLGMSRGLVMYYKTSSPGLLFWLVKVGHGTLVMGLVMGYCACLMGLWLGFPIRNYGMFGATLALAAPWLSLLLTLVSAMAQGSAQPAQVMPVLGFPLLVPGLLLLHRMSGLAVDDLEWTVFWPYFWAMLGLNAALLALGLLLFPYVWKD